MHNVKSKQETREQWINIVFKNIEKLETDIIRGIENETFNEESLNKMQLNLQHYYGAISNLRKSFSNDTFFTGFNNE